jgi:hypothetical protein
MFFSDGKLRTEPCLMDGDLHDAGRYQRRRQRQQGGDRRRDVITISMVAMTAQPMGSRNDQSRMDMLIPVRLLAGDLIDRPDEGEAKEQAEPSRFAFRMSAAFADASLRSFNPAS